MLAPAAEVDTGLVIAVGEAPAGGVTVAATESFHRVSTPVAFALGERIICKCKVGHSSADELVRRPYVVAAEFVANTVQNC